MEEVIYGAALLIISTFFLRLFYTGIKNRNFWQVIAGIIGTLVCLLLGLLLITGAFIIFYS